MARSSNASSEIKFAPTSRRVAVFNGKCYCDTKASDSVSISVATTIRSFQNITHLKALGEARQRQRWTCVGSSTKQKVSIIALKLRMWDVERIIGNSEWLIKAVTNVMILVLGTYSVPSSEASTMFILSVNASRWWSEGKIVQGFCRQLSCDFCCVAKNTHSNISPLCMLRCFFGASLHLVWQRRTWALKMKPPPTPRRTCGEDSEAGEYWIPPLHHLSPCEEGDVRWIS